MTKFFQEISRNNDVNGNPYRLVVVYDENGRYSEVYEARSSSPNIVYELYKKGYQQIMSIWTTPCEYNRIKRSLKGWGFEIKQSY